MLTVLHIIGDEPHESVRRNIYDEAAFFSRHKVDVRFICLDPVNAGTEGLAAALRGLGVPLYRLPQPCHISGGPLQPRRNSGGLSGIGGKAVTPALTLREMCLALPADVIHSHSPGSFRLACLARCLGAPAVHVYTPHILSRQSGAFGTCADRFWANWCDEFIAVDEHVAAELPGRYADASKIRRINYGLDISALSADADGAPVAGSETGWWRQDGRFTIFLAADSDGSGDGTAVETFTELVLRILRGYEDIRGLSDTRYTGLRFIFYSASEGRTAYARELAISLDLGDTLEVREAPRVADYGAADRAATGRTLLVSWNEPADLCVYYSENRFFPYPAAETAAAGIPTLTNDRMFNAELAAGAREGDDDANEGMFEADFDKQEVLARRVLELVCDSAARAAVAEAGRRAVRARFDIEDMLTGIYDLYVRGLGV